MLGFLLLLAVLRWRTLGGRALLAMSLLPKRGFYDHLPLFMLAADWRQMVSLTALSWLAVWGVPFHDPFTSAVVMYLAVLAMVLLQRPRLAPATSPAADLLAARA